MADFAARWPQQLVKCVADRNYICVVGSGISASCTNDLGERPPSWYQLITDLAANLLSVANQRQMVARLLNQSDFLGAAELLQHYVERAGRLPDLYAETAERVEGASGHAYQPGAWHDELLRLDPIVLVTTNFDRIIERATGSGYNLHLPDSSNVDGDLRTGTPVLLKVHGSVDKKEEMVLSASDFARLNRTAGHMSDILRALFTTRTCLFLGYSLQDPDVRLVLEAIMGARGVAPAHYMLTSKSTQPHLKRLFEYVYGVTLVEYRKGPHDEGLEMLRCLAGLAEDRRAAKMLIP